MKIFLTGGTGFIGGHIRRALVDAGHQLTCLIRQPSRLPAIPAITPVIGEWTKPGSWLPTVAGHDIVINAVGIIRESRGSTFDEVHNEIPKLLFASAVRAEVQKVIQISAMGTDEKATSRYQLSKRAADQYLESLGLPYLILRPSIVYGPGDHSMSLFARLASLPFTPVPGDGEYLLQPVHVEDLIRAIVMAVADAQIANHTLDLGGKNIITFNHLLNLLAYAQGRSAGARLLHIPWVIMEAVAAITDRLHFGPITSEELAMLRRGNYGDISKFIEVFDFTPMTVEAGIIKR